MSEYMNKTASYLAPLLAALLLGACASKPASYVTLLENPDGTTGKIVVRGSKGEQVIDKARYAAPMDGSTAAAPVDEEKFKKDFSAAMAARPLLPERFLLYFESGGVQLTAESAALLPKIIESTAKRPGGDVSIIGHTDNVGMADVNEGLALKRAQSIAELIKKKGLKVNAISVESHGKRNPLVKTPDETPEPRNRRVEISIR
jgi:outer membrane protein OmpA-like peptidoglycan-associated protein